MDADVFRIHSDVERRHWWFAARRRILRRVVESVAPPGADRLVVDVGCGVGGNTEVFHPDYRYVGYDPSSDAVMFAMQVHPGATFRVGSVAEAIEDLANADVVLLTDVIEHVEDDRALLRSIVAAMRPGASLLLTVPAGMELWSPHDVALGHYRRYDLDSVREAWTGLPVEPINITYFNSRLYLPIRAVRWLTSLLKRSAGGEGTDFSIPARPINALLEKLFAGEARHIAGAARRRQSAYRRGVSILALLRRTPSSAPATAQPAADAAVR